MIPAEFYRAVAKHPPLPLLAPIPCSSRITTPSSSARASDETELRPYEKRLGEGIRSFISELYLVDGGVHGLGYICGRQHENLGDIIRSSTELVIKPGRLRYGNDA